MTDNNNLQVMAMSPLFRPKASVCSLLYLDMMMMMSKMMMIMTLMMMMMITMTFIPPDSLVTCKVVILSISLALSARYLNQHKTYFLSYFRLDFAGPEWNIFEETQIKFHIIFQTLSLALSARYLKGNTIYISLNILLALRRR